MDYSVTPRPKFSFDTLISEAYQNEKIEVSQILAELKLGLPPKLEETRSNGQ